MRLLDRYVLQNFVVPFLYCTFGFLAIWLVFDLSDNGRDFIEANVKMKDLAEFYLTQFPSILVICLPVGLLLALLYSLSRMSRSNEIISMLTAGCSVVRIMVPLFLFGILITGVSFLLNYSMAPHSEEMRKVLMDKINKKDRSAELDQQLFRNRQDNRTWYTEVVEKKMNTLRGVHITQQDAEGRITTKWYANWAYFHPQDSSWTLTRGKQVNFDKAGNVLNEDTTWLRGAKKITGWSETMWRILSSNADPQDLSVPELRDYLHFNGDFPETQLAPFRTHFWYRWSVPVQCLVVIENDTNLAALGERYRGAAHEEDTFILIHIGPNVGAGSGGVAATLVMWAMTSSAVWMPVGMESGPRAVIVDPSSRPLPAPWPRSSRRRPRSGPGGCSAGRRRCERAPGWPDLPPSRSPSAAPSRSRSGRPR